MVIFVPLLSVMVTVAPEMAEPPLAVEYNVPAAVILGLWPEPWHDTHALPVFIPLGPLLAAGMHAAVDPPVPVEPPMPVAPPVPVEPPVRVAPPEPPALPLSGF
jgi:hypothetical protein